MKSILTFIGFIMLIHCSFAQQLNVTVSNELETKDYSAAIVKCGNHFIRYQPIGSSDHLMHGFGWNNTRLGIEVIQYDSNMVELKRVSFANGDRIYGSMFTDIKKINDKVYIIYHEVQPKNTVGNIMAVEVNPETLETGTPKIIGQIADTDYKLKFSESLQYSLKYFFIGSPDGKKNLVMLTTGDKRCFVSMLDENMNVLWGKVQNVVESGDYEFKSVGIDNKGNIYVGYKLYGKETEKNNSKNRIAIIHETGKPIDVILNLGAITAANLQVVPSKDNSTVHVAGTYMDNSNFAKLKGVFYTKLNIADFKLDDIKTTAFPDTLVKRFEQDGWANTKQKDFGLSRLLDFRFFEREDGVLDMIAEFRRTEQGTKAYFYFSGSIVNVSFETSGAVFARIPKIRRSVESLIGDSYTAIPFQNKVIVFYDDNDENLKKSISESPSSSNVYKNLVLIGAIIEPDGSVTRKLLIDMQDQNYLAVTESMIQENPGKIIVPLQKIKGQGGFANNTRWATIMID